MSVPEPNSREARRAAQKVRNVFFLIAAVNIVIVAIVVWPHPKPETPATRPPESLNEAPALKNETAEKTDAAEKPASPAASAMAEMEQVNERILAAYRERDAERFAQEFSPGAIPPANEDYFRKVIIGLYHEEFGDITGKKLTGETNADPNYGMLVYEVSCTKRPRAKISTNFRREDGELKAVQWRMEKL